MIYIETGSADACFNFALELCLARQKELDQPVLLLWQTEPTVMIGKYQNVAQEIDKPFADANGIRIVRRLSGGGTIYTDPGSLQFSLIENGGAQIEFARYLAPVVDALRRLGVDARQNGRNDLTVDGKKCSGNAQYRLDGRVVHHGSLLFQTDLDRMRAALTPDRQKLESKGIRSVRDRVANLAEYLPAGTLSDTSAFKAYLLRALTPSGTTRYTPTRAERARIERVADAHFRGWQNVFGADPPYNLERSARFDGGSVCVRMQVCRGVIERADFSGDFFAASDPSRLGDALRGVRRANPDVAAALRAARADTVLCGIPLDPLANLIAD